MTKRVSITLNEAQEEILQSYADAMGMPLAYAARMAMLRDLMDWKAKMSPEKPMTAVERDTAELDEEFA